MPDGNAAYNFCAFDFVATGRDTFTVEPASGTPEPAVWAMLLVGLFAIGEALRPWPAARAD